MNAEQIMCDCGASYDPIEGPEGGLYKGDDGEDRRICGPCWELANAPSDKVTVGDENLSIVVTISADADAGATSRTS
jgi:hypothetical protein